VPDIHAPSKGLPLSVPVCVTLYPRPLLLPHNQVRDVVFGRSPGVTPMHARLQHALIRAPACSICRSIRARCCASAVPWQDLRLMFERNGIATSSSFLEMRPCHHPVSSGFATSYTSASLSAPHPLRPPHADISRSTRHAHRPSADCITGEPKHAKTPNLPSQSQSRLGR
jgi:hypothetical protein